MCPIPLLFGYRKSMYFRTQTSYTFLCWHWPIFPGRLQPSIFGTAELNFRVRNGNGWTLCVKNTNLSKEPRLLTRFFCVGNDLFSRAVSSQVSSALQSLTSVFGMGTGGPSALKSPTALSSLVHLRGLEPRTHWLRVSCSTSWAKGAYPLRTLQWIISVFYSYVHWKPNKGKIKDVRKKLK